MNRGVEMVPVHRETRLEKTVVDVVIAADRRKILDVNLMKESSNRTC